MADNCTIYCRHDDQSRISGLIAEFLKRADGLPEWDGVPIQTGGSSIRFSRWVRTESGDPFCRMILGTHNRFRAVRTDATEAQQRVLNSIGNCIAAIGVVAEPKFNESAGHLDLIFAIARELDGVIFDGSGMIDSNGAMILDLEGNSET
jgi:hypothetical protein